MKPTPGAFLVTVLAATVLSCAPGAAPPPGRPTSEPRVLIEDVYRFYDVYDAADGRPTAEQLRRDYLARGSASLHELARVRDVTAERIAANLTADPQVYSDARRCMAVLPRVRDRLRRALRKLSDAYPEARLPPVAIVVGRGKPVAIGSPTSGVIIGLEALCAVQYLNRDVEDRFVHVIAHEYAHVQQTGASDTDDGTVLEGALREGAAEFMAELTSGAIAYSYFDEMTAGREAEIEAAFLADADRTDVSDWLYNGTLTEPGDLGYWVGYRIVKAYYQHADDKRRAVRDILEMTDPHAFLARSGWRPGIELR